MASCVYQANAYWGKSAKGENPVSFALNIDVAKEIIPEIGMPPVDVRTLLQEDEATKEEETQRPFRFGYAIDVNIDIKKAGVKKELPNGDKLWLLKIHSSDAYSINLIFSRFRLATGSKFFIYNEDKTMILGAFTPEVSNNPHNEFATDLVQGNTIILEYYEPASSDDGVIIINKVIHGYLNMFLSNGLGTSADCNVDINCPLGNNWVNEKRSVVMIMVDNNTAFCTGCLVNNTEKDMKPYILTARHCYYEDNGSTQTKFPATNIYRFQYWKPNCGFANPTNNGLSITGATLLAHYAPTDFALLQLSSYIPSNYNVYFSGWDRNSTPAQNATGIHHPKGDAMKISYDQHLVSALTKTRNGITHQLWRAGCFEQGTIQTGSSGSPLFNQDRRIVGQLSGKFDNSPPCSTNACDCMTPYGDYGRFDISWSGGVTDSTRLSNWLAPNSGSPPQTVDGFAQSSVISGPSEFCSGATFTATSTPAGFIWQVSPGLSIVSNSGNSITVSATGTGAGWISMKVGNVEVARRDVRMATIAPTFYGIDGPTEVTPSGYNYKYEASIPWSSHFEWEIYGAPSSWYSLSADGGGTAYIAFMGEATYMVNVTGSNACGSDYGYIYVEVYNRNNSSYTVYPNPVDDILSIEIHQPLSNANKPLRYDIHLYDLQGNLVRQTSTSRVGTVEFNVSGLPDGNYFLHIYDGTGVKPYMKQVIVQH